MWHGNFGLTGPGFISRSPPSRINSNIKIVVTLEHNDVLIKCLLSKILFVGAIPNVSALASLVPALVVMGDIRGVGVFIPFCVEVCFKTTRSILNLHLMFI